VTATLLGDLADGREVSSAERALAREAVAPPAARAPRWFVSVDVAHQDNVDTEELFFAHTPMPELDLNDAATAFRHGVVPLDVVAVPAAWRAARARWRASSDPEHGTIQWEAFVARVARPLVAALGLAPPWS
jgi:hypothetical protein